MKTIGLSANRMDVGKECVWNFARDIRVNDDSVLAMASTTGSAVEGAVSRRIAGFTLHLNGPHIDVEPAEEGDGVLVVCHGKDAVDALKEAISHLYRVVVKEKVDIRDVGAIEEIRRKKS